MKTIRHEIKLEGSVKLLLGVLAFSLILNALSPLISPQEAQAYLMDAESFNIDLNVNCVGCN